MAVDPRIEKFSLDLFLQMWNCEKYGDSLTKKIEAHFATTGKGTEVTQDIADVIRIRFLSFKGSIWNDLQEDYELFSNDGVDFYHYLRKNMDRYFAYPDMDILDKLLISCAVVFAMGVACEHHDNFMHIDFGPFSWAMYFEKRFKEEFYAEAGWEELRLYAYTCNNFSKLEKVMQQFASSNDQEVFRSYLRDCDFGVIQSIFSEKVNDRNFPTCSRCLPLFDVLHWMTSKRRAGVSNIQMLEGYLQILFRILDKDEIPKIYDMLRMLKCDSPEERAIFEKMNTSEICIFYLAKRIFKDFYNEEDSLEAEDQLDSGLCIFCDEVIDKGSITYLKSFISRKANQVVLKPDFTPPSEREVERVKKLRRFLALTDEPSLNKVRANIEEEFGKYRDPIEGCDEEIFSEDHVQNVSVSREISEKEKSLKNKRRKKKKKH